MKKTEKYVCFSLSKDLFVVPLKSVSEVYQLNDNLSLDRKASVFLGHCQLGDKNLPLINLNSVTGRGLASEHSDETCILVFDLADGPWAAVVDSLVGIIDTEVDNVQNYFELNTPICGKLFGVKKSYLLIDPEKMISKIDRLRWSVGDEDMNQVA